MKHRATPAPPLQSGADPNAAEPSAANLSAAEPPRPERWTVDGIEDAPRGRVARVELPGGETTDLNLAQLPPGVREGDLLEVERRGEQITITLLRAESRQTREQAQAKLEALNAAGTPQPGQEITL